MPPTSAPRVWPILTREAMPKALVELITRLRRGGLAVSTSETLDAIAACAAVGLGNRPLLKTALRSTLVKDDTHGVLFERAFDSVFPRSRRERSPGSGPSEGKPSDNEVLGDLAKALRDGDAYAVDEMLDEAIDRFAGTNTQGRSAGHHTQRTLKRMDVPNLYRRYLEDSEAHTDFEGAVATAEAKAAIEQMKRRLEDLISGRLREGNDSFSMQQLEDPQDRPLLRAGPDELVAIRAALRPLARQLATRLGNRRRRGTSGLDMRRTIRSSMGTGGVPIAPVLRRRRPSKPDVIVMCDVSGSTASFAPFTLTLLHAVHQEFRRVRSFVFIDGIVEISDLLASSPGVLDPHHLLGRQGLIAKDGRSDYRRVFATFLATWADAVSAKTTVIIAGDTRSHDHEPATKEIAELAHRARRLYLLNPEPEHEWNQLDSRAQEYGNHCTASFEVSTLRQLVAAVAQIA